MKKERWEVDVYTEEFIENYMIELCKTKEFQKKIFMNSRINPPSQKKIEFSHESSSSHPLFLPPPPFSPPKSPPLTTSPKNNIHSFINRERSVKPAIPIPLHPPSPLEKLGGGGEERGGRGQWMDVYTLEKKRCESGDVYPCPKKNPSKSIQS